MTAYCEAEQSVLNAATIAMMKTLLRITES
jgi:hypothetical protein